MNGLVVQSRELWCGLTFLGVLMPTYIQVPYLASWGVDPLEPCNFSTLCPWWFMILQLFCKLHTRLQNHKIVQTHCQGLACIHEHLNLQKWKIQACSKHHNCLIEFRVASANWLLAIYWSLNMIRLWTMWNVMRHSAVYAFNESVNAWLGIP